MERTTITMDGCGKVAVPSDAANVWMSEMELVRLFGVIAPTLRTAICAVYRSGVLKPCEMERYIRLPNGYYSETYTMPMVVALAFRINTPMLQVCTTPCWNGCTYEKKGKCCGLHWVAVKGTGVRVTTANLTITFC